MINLSSIIRMGAPGGKCSCQLFDLLFFQHLKHYLGHRRSLCVFPGRASHGASRKARWRHIKKIYQLIDINIGFCIVYIYAFILLEHTFYLLKVISLGS